MLYYNKKMWIWRYHATNMIYVRHNWLSGSVLRQVSILPHTTAVLLGFLLQLS